MSRKKLHDRLIVRINYDDSKSTEGMDSPCPVCDTQLSSGAEATPVVLHGRKRNCWVHRDCCYDMEEATPEQIQHAEGLERTAAADSLFSGVSSFDDVIKEIAADAGREAARCEVREMGPAIIQLHQPSGSVVDVEEHHHKVLPDCLELAARREPIFLVGPTGSGKSYIAGQIAKYTERMDSSETLPYYETPCSGGISEGHLLGRLLPTGEAGQFEYSHAVLSKAYEQGGLCCLEEVDSSDPNVLLCVNNALATQRMALPNRVNDWFAARHEDFVLTIVGNTWGSGADRMYVGRQQLDEAFLDRFRLRTVDVTYDEGLEQKLCPDDDLRNEFLRWRAAIVNHKLRRVISTRTLHRAQEDLTAGWSQEKITDWFFAGWPEDEMKLVRDFDPGTATDDDED